jgi:ABC-type uncharacterized transport system substrate-binding protein
MDCRVTRAHRLGRRRFLQTGLVVTGLGFLIGCSELPGRVSPTAKIRRIGFLLYGAFLYPPGAPGTNAAALLDGLRELGWTEGQDFVMEYRAAEFRDERLPGLATELVHLGVDVIVVSSTPVALAAKQVSATVPIVLPNMLDPVGSGLVESLARPGTNVTGLSFYGPVLSGKRLQLLKEVVPSAETVAVLWNANNPASAADFRQTQSAAAALNLQIRSHELRSADDFQGALAAIANQRPDALVVLPDNLTGFPPIRQLTVDFAAAQHLPVIYPLRDFAAEGGLMAYGPNVNDSWRRAAAYVDKILKGARPADLPVEQPSKLDFVINLKTAQALGLTIPKSVLELATEVIQ